MWCSTSLRLRAQCATPRTHRYRQGRIRSTRQSRCGRRNRSRVRWEPAAGSSPHPWPPERKPQELTIGVRRGREQGHQTDVLVSEFIRIVLRFVSLDVSYLLRISRRDVPPSRSYAQISPVMGREDVSASLDRQAIDGHLKVGPDDDEPGVSGAYVRHLKRRCAFLALRGGRHGLGAMTSSPRSSSKFTAREPFVLVALDEALGQFKAEHPRSARVVECRFFGGMTIDEKAEALDSAKRAVELNPLSPGPWETARPPMIRPAPFHIKTWVRSGSTWQRRPPASSIGINSSATSPAVQSTVRRHRVHTCTSRESACGRGVARPLEPTDSTRWSAVALALPLDAA